MFWRRTLLSSEEDHCCYSGFVCWREGLRNYRRTQRNRYPFRALVETNARTDQTPKRLYDLIDWKSVMGAFGKHIYPPHAL